MRFKFRDILKALEYSDIDHRINEFKIDDKYKQKFDDIKALGSTPVPYNFQPTIIFINESGLNNVLMNSNKPLAKIFMKKYLDEIMPAIRKTGKRK